MDSIILILLTRPSPKKLFEIAVCYVATGTVKNTSRLILRGWPLIAFFNILLNPSKFEILVREHGLEFCEI